MGDTGNKNSVGVLAIEVYFPQTFVSLQKLEEYDGVSAGKYTIGLGQRNMAFHGGNEDTVSMGLTVVDRLLTKYSVSPQQIGRLDVGSETPVDQSKSIKSYLMQYFEQHLVTDIQGCDHVNACYGGTQAFLDVCSWVLSPLWNGKFGVVVMVDDAVYAQGPARPTGGCGAVALLVGPNAPIVLDTKNIAFYSRHIYDFYKPLKPNLSCVSSFPVVDGKHSLQCYLSAFNNCYTQLSCCKYDYLALHSPFNKLVRKAVGRIWLQQILHQIASSETTLDKVLEEMQMKNQEDREKLLKIIELSAEERILQSGQFDSFLVNLSRSLYEEKTSPSQLLMIECGNSYNASLYFGLASLIYNLIFKQQKNLTKKSIFMFSYGSGLCAALFKLDLSFQNEQFDLRFQLQKICQNLCLEEKLDERQQLSPQKYTEILNSRFENFEGRKFSGDGICVGVYFLSEIDKDGKRQYKKRES